ncbi:hypothetical protein BZG17_29785, partial [Escherichia coli]|nr:hypothetical protein [Escherichia coli]
FEALRERILLHQYKIGDRVPSEKELCDEFGVSRITTKKALEMLVAKQLIVRQPGRGSFVADPAESRDRAEGGEAAAPVSSVKEARQVVETGRSALTARRRLIGLVITHFSDMYGTELLHG